MYKPINDEEYQKMLDQIAALSPCGTPTFQMSLPGIDNPRGGRRREPHQRKGESWQSYASRHETWRQATFGPSKPHRPLTKREINDRRREDDLELRRRKVVAYRKIARSKQNLFSGADIVACPDPVFFWFGGYVGQPGPGSVYVNRATVDYMERKNILDPSRGPRRVFRGISLGACGRSTHNGNYDH